MKLSHRRLFTLNSLVITSCSFSFVVLLFFIGVPFLDLIELKTYDLRFLSRGEGRHSHEIILAVIDEKSLDREGRWPWPRSKIAELIDALSSDGASVIGLDIGFLEPDENSNLLALNEIAAKLEESKINDPEFTEFINDKKRAANNDLMLAEAIINASTPVVLGYFFHISRTELGYGIEQERLKHKIDQISPSKYPLVLYEKNSLTSSPFRSAYAPESNLEIFTDATDYSGYFNMFPDRDGVVRWASLMLQCEGDLFPPLSLLCAWHQLDRPKLLVRVSKYGVEGVQMGERLIPTDESGNLLINYRGPSRTFPHFSVSEIINKKIPKGTFKDKIVLVGSTAVGLYDLRNTPFSPVFPGVEVHATVIDNILREDFMKKPPWTMILDSFGIIAMSIFTGLFLIRLGGLKSLGIASGLFILYLATARWFFSSVNVWINVVYPLLSIFLTYTSLTLYSYMTEEREKKKIRGAFSFYVSKSVVNEMLENPDRLKLGGDERDLTVLFADIRDFTKIAEDLSPEELVRLLNEYLTVMTDIVFEYDGTLDKYIGDAIMAFYGAPVERPNHAANACGSALRMLDELKRLNDKWIREGKRAIDIGIGINTGMMMVGNMGSDQRFDYTAMGDGVNLGSRLEGANKNYRSHILISEETYKRVKDEYICMEVDTIRVKGKNLPVRIYQLIAHRRISEDKNKALHHFQKGLGLYRKRSWDNAIEHFRRAEDLDPDLRITEVYIDRCQKMKKNPPPLEWDGVYTMKTK